MGNLVRPDGSVPNIIATLVHHTELCQAWIAFSRTLLRTGLLPDRDREIIILRVAWSTQSLYEWRQHAWRIDEETLDALSGSPDSEFWSAAERDLIRCVDEFCASEYVDDANWSILAARYDDRELLEVVFLCSMYRALSSAIRILGIEPDTETPPLPPLNDDEACKK
jgi:alkylhydroperoxidase family enzyme